MKLINYENYKITPTEDCFFMKEFRDIFNKDKSDTKETFMQTLSYVYFFADPRSPYKRIKDEEERKEIILREQSITKVDTDSDKINSLLKNYEILTTTTTQKLLYSMDAAINKISQFLEDVDLYETDDKGKPKYTVTSIVEATNKAPDLAKKLIETEKIVNSEILELGRARGGNESKKLYEDGFSFK